MLLIVVMLIFWFVSIVVGLIALWCSWLGVYAAFCVESFLIALCTAAIAEVQQIIDSTAIDVSPGFCFAASIVVYASA